MAAKALFLYIKDKGEDGETLKDYIQTQLGTGVNLINILDVVAEDYELFGTLKESKCVVLVGSKKTAQMIEEGAKEFEEGVTTFDGKVIRDFFHNEENLRKMILVFLGEAGCNQWIPAGVPDGRVFTVNIAENIQKNNGPVLDQIMDIITGLVKKNP